MDARWDHKLRKSVSAPKYVMCVWHSKNCGQLHIPLPGIPENTARKIPRNRCPPSSRHNTLKTIKISKMYRKPSHLEVHLEVKLWAFSHLFPESEPKCPKGAQMEPKDTTMEPQGHSKPTKSRIKVLQGWQNGPPGATTEPQGWQNGAPRSPKVLKRRYKVFQSATKTLKCGPRCPKNDIPTYRHISSKIHDIFFKCRRQCFAHQ